MHHEGFLNECKRLARIADENNESPVGAILVHNNKIIGSGIESAKAHDVTCHAEILAIRDAVHQGFAKNLRQSILYSTHEPCLMCSYAIRHYRIPTLVCIHKVVSVGGVSSDFKVLETQAIATWGDVPEIIFWKG